MKKKFSKDSLEWQLMMDFWNFWQDNGEPEDNDNYWEEIVLKAKVYEDKYKNTKLSKLQIDLFVSVVEALDRQIRGVAK